jgi:hypothetical protein
MFGEPDVIQVRLTYGDDAKLARHCEDKVLRRLKVVVGDKWLNQSMNNSFRGQHSSWNEGLTKETCVSLKSAGVGISASRKLKPSPGSLGKTKSKLQCEVNAWAQITKHSPNFMFSSYDEFKRVAIELVGKGLGPYAVGAKLGVDSQAISTLLNREGLVVTPNQSWTKIKARYPDFRFGSYDEFCRHCNEQIDSGSTVYRLSKDLGLSNCTIKKAINRK